MLKQYNLEKQEVLDQKKKSKRFSNPIVREIAMKSKHGVRVHIL